MTFYSDQVPGRTVRSGEREYLYFGGTSYLGLQSDPEFQSILLNCIQKHGANHGASRSSNLRLSIYEEVESHLAAWVGSEAALSFSSGFLAGQMLVHLFRQRPYRAFCGPGTHPAVAPGAIGTFDTVGDLAVAIEDAISNSPEISPVLFIDSVDLAGTSYPSYEVLQGLPLDKIILVADDSHGIGILGGNGSGVYQALQEYKPRELLVCCSLGKALGIQGGVIFGKAERLREIWDTPFFTGASPAPPGHMATLIQVCPDLLRQKRTQLQKNIGLFEATYALANHFRNLPNHPVYGFNNPELAPFLTSQGIIVTDFPYAAQAANPFSGRIVLSAHHREEDIHRLANALKSFGPLPEQ